MDEQGQSDERQRVPTEAAVCGLYCEACALYIASREGPMMLRLLAGRLGQTEEETYCDGCRAERRSKYCQTCTLYVCAAERGLDFCVECADFPCDDLKTFQCQMPHRADLFVDLQRIAEIGPREWTTEAAARYACPDCGTINSAYHIRCRSCGHDPASAFIVDHEDEIVAHLARG